MTIQSHQLILGELRAEFQAVAYMSEERFLLPAEDAVEFIHRGIESGLRLVGVEGYTLLHTGCVQYQPGLSSDIGDRDMPYEEFIVNTIDLIQAGSSEGILFDVVFEIRTRANSQ